jgi:hypothetical protein
MQVRWSRPAETVWIKPGDPARRAAAKRDHAEGCKQEHCRTHALSQCEPSADQPESDPSTHQVTSD